MPRKMTIIWKIIKMNIITAPLHHTSYRVLGLLIIGDSKELTIEDTKIDYSYFILLEVIVIIKGDNLTKFRYKLNSFIYKGTLLII